MCCQIAASSFSLRTARSYKSPQKSTKNASGYTEKINKFLFSFDKTEETISVHVKHDIESEMNISVKCKNMAEDNTRPANNSNNNNKIKRKKGLQTTNLRSTHMDIFGPIIK